MQVKSVHIQGFRSIHDQVVTFESGITTFVGENSTGKSAVGAALAKLFGQASSSNDMIQSEDYQRGGTGSLVIEAILELSDKEVHKHLVT
ncbi:MAG: AAA family ATPase, partial [Chloroflexi bacterium]|nr:AAA family ATPase [Chloroflexota bacterium]